MPNPKFIVTLRGSFSRDVEVDDPEIKTPEQAVAFVKKTECETINGAVDGLSVKPDFVEWHEGTEEHGAEVAGICESCEKTILHFSDRSYNEQSYVSDAEGCLICEACQERFDNSMAGRDEEA